MDKTLRKVLHICDGCKKEFESDYNVGISMTSESDIWIHYPTVLVKREEPLDFCGLECLIKYFTDESNYAKKEVEREREREKG